MIVSPMLQFPIYIIVTIPDKFPKQLQDGLNRYMTTLLQSHAQRWEPKSYGSTSSWCVVVLHPLNIPKYILDLQQDLTNQ